LSSRLSPLGSVGAASRREDQQALVHGKEEPDTAGQVPGAGRRHEPSGVRPRQWRRHSTAGAGGDGCSGRRVVIRAGWVSKPLGRTGERVASAWPFPAARLARSRTRRGPPHHPSTWRKLWWCDCGGIVPLLRRPWVTRRPPPSCCPGQRARKAALPGPPAGRHRPNAQARTAILPPVEVRPVSRAIPTLSNLTSHIQRSVPGGRPIFTPARLQPHSFAPTSATPIIDPLCALPPQASGELVNFSHSRWAYGRHHRRRPP